MSFTRRFEIFADYYQFVLMDVESEDDFSEIWTDEAIERMLAVGDRVVCPGTLRNTDVVVEIEVGNGRPGFDLASCDHAVEGSLELPSGCLVVMGCTGYLPDAERVALTPGIYELVFTLNGANTSQEIYKVHLWLGPSVTPRVLKQWNRGEA